MISEGGEEILYREDSQNGKKIEAVSAYQSYLKDFENYKCNFAYINDDDSPECICKVDYTVYELAYTEVGVIEVHEEGEALRLLYNRLSGGFVFENALEYTTYHVYYELNDGGFENKGTSEKNLFHPTENGTNQDLLDFVGWRINAEPASESDYYSFENGFGTYAEEVAFEYDNVNDAFINMP